MQELMIFEQSLETFHVDSTSKFEVICHPCKFNEKPTFGCLKYIFHSTWQQSLMYVLCLEAINYYQSFDNMSNSLVDSFEQTYIRQKNIYWSTDITISLRRTKHVLKTVLLSEMTLSLFGFMTCSQDHISLSEKFDIWLSTSECIESAKFLSLSETATSAYRSVSIPIHWKIDEVCFRCLFTFGCVPSKLFFA